MTATRPRRPVPRSPHRRFGGSPRRFAARARAQRIKRIALRLIVSLTVISAVGAVAWVVGWSSAFALHGVRVEGASNGLRTKVLAAADAPTGTPLIRIDTAAVQSRVARVAEVADADVSRAFPQTLVIRITPRVPVAAVDTGRRWMLVDASGVAYASVAQRPDTLARLNTSAAQSDREVRAAAVAVLGQLPKQLGERVVEVRARTVDDVRLELPDDVEVIWGSAEHGTRKAAVLQALLQEDGKVYDVSVPDHPTIRPE
jgi:cell division protein FtsQ